MTGPPHLPNDGISPEAMDLTKVHRPPNDSAKEGTFQGLVIPQVAVSAEDSPAPNLLPL